MFNFKKEHKLLGILTKEEGREYIKQIPLYVFEKVAHTSKRSIVSKNYEVKINGKHVKMNRQIMLLTLFNDVCVFCGEPFTHYAIVQNKPHHVQKKGTIFLAPFKYDENQQKVWYNIDHIIPQSKGGADVMENYQLSCCLLNMKKSNNVSTEELKIGKRKNPINHTKKKVKNDEN